MILLPFTHFFKIEIYVKGLIFQDLIVDVEKPLIRVTYKGLLLLILGELVDYSHMFIFVDEPFEVLHKGGVCQLLVSRLFYTGAGLGVPEDWG